MTVRAECEKCGHKWDLELEPCETITCPNCKTVYDALIVMNDPENEKAKKRVKGFKCQDNCEKSYVMGALDFAEPREKRIAELEKSNTSLLSSVENLNKSVQELEKENAELILGNKSLSAKLMNTTREKLDLQKENAELKEHIKADCIDCTDYYKNKRLEKENAELKEKSKRQSDNYKHDVGFLKESCKYKNEVCKELAHQANVIQDNLTKAKELLEKWYKQHSDKGYTETFYQNLLRETENLLWSEEK